MIPPSNIKPLLVNNALFGFKARRITNVLAQRLFSFDKETSDKKTNVHDNGDDRGALLCLSPTLWPEPNSSAAGVRTMSLLRHFSQQTVDTALFDSVHYGSGASLRSPSYNNNSNGEHDGVQMHRISANRTDDMQILISSLPDLRAVLFDRFFSEEAYSFHFCHPHGSKKVLRILDMQDFHSLRNGRQRLVEAWDASCATDGSSGKNKQSSMPSSLMETLISYHPELDTTDSKITGKKKNRSDDYLLRELASIHRSDLTLVCSPKEANLLTNVYGVPSSKLVLAPFFTNEEQMYYDDNNSFDIRHDFVFIGGFQHAPNVDAVRYLKRELWPHIRQGLSVGGEEKVRLFVYGAYAPRHILELHDESMGFLVKGFAGQLKDALGSHRVLLAPLRYGAGIKGKIVDAWRYGCPVVTTPIGAEGMMAHNDILTEQRNHVNQKNINKDTGWGGLIAWDTDSFVRSVLRLYRDKELWNESRQNARRLLKVLYDETHNLKVVTNAIQTAMDELETRRKNDYLAAMLWHQSARSTEYFSRWIELKETSGTKEQ